MKHDMFLPTILAAVLTVPLAAQADEHTVTTVTTSSYSSETTNTGPAVSTSATSEAPAARVETYSRGRMEEIEQEDSADVYGRGSLTGLGTSEGPRRDASERSRDYWEDREQWVFTTQANDPEERGSLIGTGTSTGPAS